MSSGFGVAVVPWRNWTDATFEHVAEESSGRWLRVMLACAAFVGCCGTFMNLVCASALALQCLGELSIVPSIFAYQSPRFKTPVVSILFVSGAAAGLCHLTYVTKYRIAPTGLLL